MYDFVSAEIPLVGEEQDKVMAIRVLARRKHAISLGNKAGLTPLEQGALEAFEHKLFDEIRQRLGDTDELLGSWSFSRDSTMLLICQVRQVKQEGEQ